MTPWSVNYSNDVVEVVHHVGCWANFSKTSWTLCTQCGKSSFLLFNGGLNLGDASSSGVKSCDGFLTTGYGRFSYGDHRIGAARW